MIKNFVGIIIQLYSIWFLPDKKNSRTGRVVSTGSLKIEDVAKHVVMRGSDFNYATLMASYTLLRDAALKMILEGKCVEFGLSHYRLDVRGLFEGDYPAWNDEVHELYLRATTIAEVREALKAVNKEIRGAAHVGIVVNKLLDKASGLYNTCITPGGGVILTGFKMKIVGKADGVGLFLTNIDTAVETKVPTISILENKPAKLAFIVPPDLPLGNYNLSIVSQFSSGVKVLKEPRKYVFDHILECVTGKPKKKIQESNVENQDSLIR